MLQTQCPCCAQAHTLRNLHDLAHWTSKVGARSYEAAYAVAVADGPVSVAALEANPPPGAAPRGGLLTYSRQRVTIADATKALTAITGGQVVLFATTQIADAGDAMVFFFAAPGSAWEALPGMEPHNAARDAYMRAPRTARRLLVSAEDTSR